MQFPLKRHDLWAIARFDSDGDGGGGAGDTAGPDESTGYGDIGAATGADAGAGAGDVGGIGGGGGGVGSTDAGTAGQDFEGVDYGGFDATGGFGVDTGTAGQDFEGVDYSGFDNTFGGFDGLDAGGQDFEGFGYEGFDNTFGGFDDPEGEEQGFLGRAIDAYRALDFFENPNPTTFGLTFGPMMVANPMFGIGALGLKGLGALATALGATPGTDVEAYGASIGDVGSSSDGSVAGAGGAAGGDYGDLFDPGTVPILPNQPYGGVPGSTPPITTTPDSTGWQRPGDINIPPDLLAYLSPAMTNRQMRSAIATGALYNANPAYRTNVAQQFYDQLIQNALIDASGNFNDFNEILPVEHQYLLQSRGIEGYDPSVQSLLEALTA